MPQGAQVFTKSCCAGTRRLHLNKTSFPSGAGILIKALLCRHMWLASKERLNVHFNPASLLSFGDALAFVNTLLSQDVVILGPQGPELVSSPTKGPGAMARLAAPENAPKMSEQMAVNADLTSRIPQKYLIQNQSGLRVYYWADEVSHGVFSHTATRHTSPSCGLSV